MTHQANPWGPKQRLSVPLPGGQNPILSGALAAEKLKKQGMVVPRRGTRPQITTGPTNAPSSLRPLFTSFGRQYCPQIKAMGKVRCCTRVLPVNAIVLQFLEGHSRCLVSQGSRCPRQHIPATSHLSHADNCLPKVILLAFKWKFELKAARIGWGICSVSCIACLPGLSVRL